MSEMQEVTLENLTAETLRGVFRESADFNMNRFELGGKDVWLLYCEGMADGTKINWYILDQLNDLIPLTNGGQNLDTKINVKRVDDPKECISLVYSGKLIIFIEDIKCLYAYDLTNPPQRAPQDSNIEVSIQGPRDAFVEELITNVALVRKRLRTNSLAYEQFKIGKRSQTTVALLYIQDVSNPKLIEEVRRRLSKIDIDVMYSAAQLEEMIADEPNSFFPLISATTRPDFVVDCLMRGRFAVLVDGAPNAIVGPVNLTFLLRSVEDTYLPYYIASFKIFFRFIGFFFATLLPGFWIAVSSFNLEQIPYTLLATIALSRIGLPLSAPVEAFIMLIFFEVFREAGERLPRAVGGTIAVVGGIVIGDAAIKAGLASTTYVVVIALAAVASYTLINQSLVGSVSVIRIMIMIASSFLGIYGFILSTIALVLYLSRLESFGLPFLAPLSPIRFSDIPAAIIRKPWYQKIKRPEILKTVDSDRQKDGKKRGNS